MSDIKAIVTILLCPTDAFWNNSIVNKTFLLQIRPTCVILTTSTYIIGTNVSIVVENVPQPCSQGLIAAIDIAHVSSFE